MRPRKINGRLVSEDEGEKGREIGTNFFFPSSVSEAITFSNVNRLVESIKMLVSFSESAFTPKNQKAQRTSY